LEDEKGAQELLPLRNQEPELAFQLVVNNKKARGAASAVHRINGGAPKTVCGLLSRQACRPAGQGAEISCARCLHR